MILFVLAVIVLLGVVVAAPAYLLVLMAQNWDKWQLLEKLGVAGIAVTWLAPTVALSGFAIRKEYWFLVTQESLKRWVRVRLQGEVIEEEKFIAYNKSSWKSRDLARVLRNAHAFRDRGSEHFLLPNRVCVERYVSVAALVTSEDVQQRDRYCDAALKDLARRFEGLNIDKVISFGTPVNLSLGPDFGRFLRKGDVFLTIQGAKQHGELSIKDSDKTALEERLKVLLFEANLVDPAFVPQAIALLKRECPAVEVAGVAVLFDHTQVSSGAKRNIPGFKGKVVRLIGIESGLRWPACGIKVHEHPQNIEENFPVY